MDGQPIFAGSGAGAVLRVVEDDIRVLAAGADTGGAYEIFELSGPRASGPPPHSHPWSEAYVLLEGEVEVTLGERKLNATPGSFVNIPAGLTHAYRVLSEGARFIVVTSPAGAGAFFADVDRETGGAMDLEKIIEVALRHGLTVPPPPAVA